MDELEKMFGKMTLWEWTREWMENEAECEDDEKCTLQEYLWLKAGKDETK